MLARRILRDVDSSGEALSLAVKEGVFLIKPNLREFTQLVKREIRDESNLRTLAKQIIDSGQSEAVLISLGAGGATLVTNEIHEHIRAPIVPVESKIGAGDSMVAGIVLALTKGLPLQKAARFGVAAGAAAVMTPGTELCRRQDVVRLYKLMSSVST
jgi:6-phosphofructokinase 2